MGHVMGHNMPITCETYGLRDVLEGFQATVGFSSGRKVFGRPQGVLTSVRRRKPLVFQRFPTFPMQIQGAAGKDKGRKIYSEQVLKTQLSAYRFG